MATIINTDMWGQTREFEIIDTFPEGYVVWNIGRENFPYQGFIPLCNASPDYEVDIDTLKALFVGDETSALKIMRNAHRVTVNQKKFLEFIGKDATK